MCDDVIEECYAGRLEVGFHLLSDELNSSDDGDCVFDPWELWDGAMDWVEDEDPWFA
jgi:hypothetical protein